MDKAQVVKALDELKKEKKRKFLQSYDFIVTLKDIDIKTKPVDAFIVLPYSRGKKVRVCALVGQELAEKAGKSCDFVIRDLDFTAYKSDKKKTKQLALAYDFFVAQAGLMPQIAAVFGRTLGPRGKMPNPKAGCVIPPNADVTGLVERLHKTIHLKTKNAAVVQCIIGNEGMSDAEVADNIIAAYSQLVKLLPSEENNIRAVYLKKTMSKPVKV